MNISRAIDKDRAVRTRTDIRYVLMNYWDPIGVKDEPIAADEYDMYIGGIHELLFEKATDAVISNHLRTIEIKRMGFSEEQVPNHVDIAAKLKQISLD